MTIRVLIVACLACLINFVAVADPPRPSQPYPITKNDPAYLDRSIKEIYNRILIYLDSLNQLRRDSANYAVTQINLYDDTASQGLWKATKARDTANIAYARINLYDDTASLALWNTGNNVTVKRVNADTVKSHNSDGDLYLEVGTGIVVIRDLNDNGPGQLYFREKPSNGTSYIGLEAPASLSASKLFVLPATDGSSGQVIQTNGSGTLSFITRATQAEIHDSLANRAMTSQLWSKYSDTINVRGAIELTANKLADTISTGVTFADRYFAVTITPEKYTLDGTAWGYTWDSLGLGYNLVFGHVSTSQFVVCKKYSEAVQITWTASGR